MDDDMNEECLMKGHDEEVLGEDDGEVTYTCRRCGAEWWEAKKTRGPMSKKRAKETKRC